MNSASVVGVHLAECDPIPLKNVQPKSMEGKMEEVSLVAWYSDKNVHVNLSCSIHVPLRSAWWGFQLKKKKKKKIQQRWWKETSKKKKTQSEGQSKRT